jgi:hypothetical protein
MQGFYITPAIEQLRNKRETLHVPTFLLVRALGPLGPPAGKPTTGEPTTPPLG